MHNYTIYALDIAILSEDLKPRNTSWVKLNSNGEIDSVGYNIRDLSNKIAADLNNNLKVALGFEAPMWIPMPKLSESHHFKMTGRFKNELERNSIRWFEGGAAPLVKTLPIGYFLFTELLKHRIGVTATTTLSQWGNADLFLFEGFATGSYKGIASSHFTDFKNQDSSLTNDDLVDAFIIGSAFYQKLSGSYTPLLCAIPWAHHLEVTSSCLETGEFITTTWNRDVTGTVQNGYDTTTHWRVTSVWDMIKERVNADIAVDSQGKFHISNPHEACNIYGFMF